MSLDIPLAGWILSVITFVVGSILPILYRRFVYEGVAIRQPVLFRGIHQSEKGIITFITRVKIANVQKDPVMLDVIRLPKIVTRNIVFFPKGNLEVSILEKSDISYYVPLSIKPNYIPEHLPLIVRAGETQLIDFGFDYTYKPNAADNAAADNVVDIFSGHVEQKGLPVGFRINGKYRDYVLKLPSHADTL